MNRLSLTIAPLHCAPFTMSGTVRQFVGTRVEWVPDDPELLLYAASKGFRVKAGFRLVRDAELCVEDGDYRETVTLLLDSWYLPG